MRKTKFFILEIVDGSFKVSTNSEAIDYSFWKVLDSSVIDEEKFIKKGDTIRMGNNFLHIVRNKNLNKDFQDEKSESKSASNSSDSPDKRQLMECESPQFFQEETDIREKPKPQNASGTGGKGVSSLNTLAPRQVKGVPCRICFDDTSSEEDPIFSPCSCTGSISCIHLKCLKQWLDVKTQIKKKSRPHVSTWDLSKFKCELCLTYMPGKHFVYAMSL